MTSKRTTQGDDPGEGCSNGGAGRQQSSPREDSSFQYRFEEEGRGDEAKLWQNVRECCRNKHTPAGEYSRTAAVDMCNRVEFDKEQNICYIYVCKNIVNDFSPCIQFRSCECDIEGFEVDKALQVGETGKGFNKGPYRYFIIYSTKLVPDGTRAFFEIGGRESCGPSDIQF